MGGNAIKNKKTGKSICGRLTKQDYEKVKAYMLKKFADNNIVSETVLELPGKPDFGDIDIEYVSQLNFNTKDFVKTEIGLDEDWHIVTNGNVISFAFDCTKAGIANQSEGTTEKKYFQIDLLKVQSLEHLEMTRFYLSYGDIGSIIGRIAKYYGLTYGDVGLWCDLLEHTVNPESNFDVRSTLGKIFLCEKPEQICTYLDFDYNFWKNEIPNLEAGKWESIYKWIMKSKLFKPEIFKCLNTYHRDRLVKRPFYESFVRYIGIAEVTRTGDALQAETGGQNENMQLNAIQFFKKEKEMVELVDKVMRGRLRGERFSGNDVIALYDEIHKVKMEGKDLGDTIQMIKHNIEIDSKMLWNDFLDKHTRDEVLAKVRSVILQHVINCDE
jgi:hypothetical protein